MKKLLAIALILLFLASNSFGVPEQARKPETINVFLGFPDCNIKVINFTVTPPAIKCRFCCKFGGFLGVLHGWISLFSVSLFFAERGFFR